MYFTTSWDDGHPLDLRVAELLRRFDCTGTFYVCRSGFEGRHLSVEQIVALSSCHELGAHTLTHPSLPTLTLQEMDAEIAGSKRWLEDLLGRECRTFAYPYGSCDRVSRDRVEAAGFVYARTTEELVWDVNDPLLFPTSLQLHHFPFRPVPNRRFLEPLRTLWPRLRACQISVFACRNWLAMAKAAFFFAHKSGKEWFHLWGHSWSLERFDLWASLEAFLAFVNTYEGVKVVPNSTLLQGGGGRSAVGSGP